MGSSGYGPAQFAPLIGVYLVLTLTAVSLRLWVRARVTKSWGQDDWHLLAAQSAMTVHFCIYFAVSALFPDGYPAEIDSQTFHKVNVLWFWATMSYAGSQVALKTSLGLFFLNLAKADWQRRLILVPITMFIAYNTTLGLVLVFRCGIPVRAVDVLTRTDGQCPIGWSVIGPMLVANGIFGAALDWTFAIVPIFMVLGARKMKRGSRRAIWILIILAMLGSVFSIIRIPFIQSFKFGPDAWRSTLRMSLISATESAMGTLAISLATLRPLLRPVRRFYDRLIGGTASSSYDHEARPPLLQDNQPRVMDESSSSPISLDTSALGGIGILPDASLSTWSDSSLTKVMSTGAVSSTGATSRLSEAIAGDKTRYLVSISELPSSAKEESIESRGSTSAS